MGNRTDKPKQTAQQLIAKMKNEKGISFKYTSESDAENYLANINNYLRTAAYRKNYQKHKKGINNDKYICLDFAYLQELSTIDMHFRFIVSKMCLDIEHDLKVKMLKDIDEEYRTTLINFAKYKLVMFAMAKFMEMETTERNKVALYLFNNIKT